MDEEDDPVKKSLWILLYAYDNSLEMNFQPFYGVDQEDVQEQVKQFLDSQQPFVSEHHLQSALGGFNIHNTTLPGVIDADDDEGSGK
jgi:hypothetical protein